MVRFDPYRQLAAGDRVLAVGERSGHILDYPVGQW